MRTGKVAITLLITVLLLFICGRVSIHIDQDSVYKVDLPKEMRVAHFTNNSKKDFYKNIRVDKQKLPEIQDNDVLVMVHAASFTDRDFEFFNRVKGRKEFVPCSDFAGRVVAVGKNVKDYEVGDKVFGIADLENKGGACADYVAVPKNNIYPIPYSLTYKQAAAIPSPALLNWLAFHQIDKKGFGTGTVLIDDAISEVGIMLTGLLVRNGFEVSGIDREQVKSWVEGFGVKNFYAYEKIDEHKKELEGKYDVVINLKHGMAVEDLLKFVKKGGTFISFEKMAAGKRDDVKIIVIDNAKITKDVFAKMARLVHLGKLKINVAKEFGLEHIRDAYMRSEKGNLDGKVIVNINE